MSQQEIAQAWLPITADITTGGTIMFWPLYPDPPRLQEPVPMRGPGQKNPVGVVKQAFMQIKVIFSK